MGTSGRNNFHKILCLHTNISSPAISVQPPAVLDAPDYLKFLYINTFPRFYTDVYYIKGSECVLKAVDKSLLSTRCGGLNTSKAKLR